MWYSKDINGLTRKSYGIELCSENLASSTIDFSEPTGTYYGRRILHNNTVALYVLLPRQHHLHLLN